MTDGIGVGGHFWGVKKNPDRAPQDKGTGRVDWKWKLSGRKKDGERSPWIHGDSSRSGQWVMA